MKKNMYTQPTLEVVEFDVQDIITASGDMPPFSNPEIQQLNTEGPKAVEVEYDVFQ